MSLQQQQQQQQQQLQPQQLQDQQQLQDHLRLTSTSFAASSDRIVRLGVQTLNHAYQTESSNSHLHPRSADHISEFTPAGAHGDKAYPQSIGRYYQNVPQYYPYRKYKTQRNPLLFFFSPFRK